MTGSEHSLSPVLGSFERIYIRLFGYPAHGLRIRARGILPLVQQLDQPRSILDAGCGKGVFTFAAARMHPQAEIIGVDNNAEQITINREIATAAKVTNCRFAAGNVLSIQDHSPYDAILCTDLLEHIEDDSRVLKRFGCLLKEKGTLLLHVPHLTRNVFGWKRRNFMGIEGHVRPGYTRPQLDQLLSENDLEVRFWRYSFNSFDTLLNDISYLITGGREKRRRLYAVAFPLLLVLSRVFSRWPTGEGSGLIFEAVKKA